eukprot:2777648-Rhodomonas_salina.1
MDKLDMRPHVYSSAWIGGGLFNDTTYHLAKGNSYLDPYCNWSALDVRRVATQETELPMALFKRSNTFEEIVGENEYLTQFLPYQPNSYIFTLNNAHCDDNISVMSCPLKKMACLVASAQFSEETL